MRITDTVSAIAYLTAAGTWPALVGFLAPDGETLVMPDPCERCGGLGYIQSYRHVEGGVCFDCHGENTSRCVKRFPLKWFAQNEKRKANARAKADAKRQAAHEARLAAQREITGGLTFAEAKKQRAAQREAEQAARRMPAPEGKVTFQGRVIKADSRPGYTRGSVEYKMTVLVTAEDGREWLAWMTVPAAMLDSCPIGTEGRLDSLRGATVEVTATLTRGKDEHFALGKRPRGKVLALRDGLAEVLAAEQAEDAAWRASL